MTKNVICHIAAALLLVSCHFSVHGAQRSAAEALDKAIGFHEPEPGTRIGSYSDIVPVDLSVSGLSCAAAKADNRPFYIFNRTSSPGFVIVSGDTRMRDILAYSNTSTFDPEDMAPALIDLLEFYSSVYTNIKEVPDNNAEANNRYNKPHSPVSPLIQSKWNQREPFNNACPSRYGTRCVTGCVATSMSQVMNYNHYPEQPTGEISYTSSWGASLSADLSTIHLVWDNMLNSYNSSYTNEQGNAVAQLMKAAGYSVYMNYGNADQGSSARAVDIPYALINNFNYNPNIYYAERLYYSEDEWMDLLDNELDGGRPVIYGAGGPGPTGYYGHSFIIDGRDYAGRFHANFGWGGIDDGYYSLDAMSAQGVSYIYEHNMIVNITPQLYGEHYDVFYSQGFDISVGTYLVNVSLQPCCYCSDAQYRANKPDPAKSNGIIGIGVFDRNFSLVKTVFEAAYTDRGIGDGYNIINQRLSLNLKTYKDGDQFYLRPYAKSENSDTITFMRTPKGEHDWYLLTKTDGVFSSTPCGIMEEEPIVYPDTITVENNVAGQLSSQIPNPAIEAAHTMIVSGELNSDDILFVKTIMTRGMMKHIDLSNSRIVEGGNPYYMDVATTCDVVGTHMFYNCDQLESLALPAGATTIETDAIALLSNLECLILPDSCATISEGALNKLPGIRSLALPASLSSFDGLSIVDCAALDSVHVADESTSLCSLDGVVYDKQLTSLVFYPANHAPDYVIPDSIVAIGRGCFSSSAIKSIEIPGTVAEIAESAFGNCNRLKSVTCHIQNPDSIVVAPDAFTGIPKDCSWIIPYATTETYKAAPWWQSTWQIEEMEGPQIVYSDTIAIEDNVAGQLRTIVPTGAVEVATTLILGGELNSDDIRFVKEIMCNGLLAHMDLSKCRIVAAVEPYFEIYATADDVIGSYMFNGCTTLETLILPETATAIEPGAVGDMPLLHSLTLPADCETIADGAFYNMPGIKCLDLPASVNRFDGLSIVDCAALDSVRVATESLALCDLDGVVYSKDLTTVVYYPSNHGPAYVVPDSVTTIARGCFSRAAIESIEIPETVTQISEKAFSQCGDLRMVTCYLQYLDSIEVATDAFDGMPDDCVWVIPHATTEIYTAAEWWHPSWQIIEMEAGVHDATLPDGQYETTFDGDALTINSNRTTTVVIYDLNGRIVNIVAVHPGSNRIIVPRNTVILVGGKKIRT